MKKFSFILVFALILGMPFVLFACNTSKKVNSYSIVAQYDEQEHALSCSQQVVYNNTGNNALTEVCFFLYPNAFSEGQKVVPTSYNNKAYPNGENFGNIEILSAKVNKQTAEFSISEQGNILTVPLSKKLFPDESVTIDLDYTVNLANIRHRLGYYENTANFGNFFPIACVYENGFIKNEFSPNGDPFYSEVSAFNVEIKFPKEYIIACTGEVEQKTEGELKIANCHAENVRDFCFVLSKDFQEISQKVGDVEVKYFFYDDENAQDRLNTAAKSVETFEKLFGKYIYGELSVVKTGFCFGGMEYPNLVMIADDLPDAQQEDYVIVHEIAHQWWYGMVGNNEFENAWLDEGLTEFSTALFFEENEEYLLDYDIIMKNAADSYNNFVKIYTNINGSADQTMNRKLTEFATEPEYVNITYTKGMLLFDAVRNMMSDKKFFGCLQDYYNNYCLKNSSVEKLIQSFSRSAKINMEGLFKAWLDGTVRIGG